MKKIFKILTMITILIPIYICAATTDYEDSILKANQYISNFEDYHDYIMYENMLYNYEKGENKSNFNFRLGGFVSKDEYLITNAYGKSYLGTGIEYWTLTQHSLNKNFVIDFSLQSKSISEKTNVRVTEFVKNEVKVKGEGTRNTPWEFLDVKSINLYSSNKNRGTLSQTGCTNITEGQEKITLAIYENMDGIFSTCTTPYYRYKTTTCSSYINSIANSNKHNVDNAIIDNTICRVDFGYETFNITLEECSNCTAVYPNKIYLAKNHDNFFNDDFGDTIITELTTKPTKTGYTFTGYEYNGVKVIDNEG